MSYSLWTEESDEGLKREYVRSGPWLIAAAEDVVGSANGNVCDFRDDIFLVTAFKLQFIAHAHELCTRLIIYA